MAYTLPLFNVEVNFWVGSGLPADWSTPDFGPIDCQIYVQSRPPTGNDVEFASAKLIPYIVLRMPIEFYVKGIGHWKENNTLKNFYAAVFSHPMHRGMPNEYVAIVSHMIDGATGAYEWFWSEI